MRFLMLHIVLIPALIAVLLGGAGSVLGQGDDPFPRAVIDASGATVVIPAYPARVAMVGAVPALDQIVSGEELVTLDPQMEPDPAFWQDVGVLLLPSLYASAYPAWVSSAQAAGVPVVQVGPVTSVAGWRDWLADIGRITGRDRAARLAIRRLQAGLTVARWIGGFGDPAGVLVLTPEGYTVGQGALLTDVIAAAGGVNVAAAAGYDDYRQLTDDLVRELAPDVVLLTPAWGDEGRAAFIANAAHAELPAVAADHVCLLPFGSTQIARPGSAALILALMLHGVLC